MRGGLLPTCDGVPGAVKEGIAAWGLEDDWFGLGGAGFCLKTKEFRTIIKSYFLD